MIVAVVPAAGKSQRMGRPKLLLPLGNRLVLEHVLDALQQSPIDRSFVVISPGSNELLEVARQFERVEVVQLDQPTPDMRASIVAGLSHIESMFTQSRHPDGFLVALADQPTVSSRVIRALIETFLLDRPSIVVPTHGGKNGHPILFAWTMLEKIRAIPADRGMNYLLSHGSEKTVRVPVGEHELPYDLDTPTEYERIEREWNDGLWRGKD
jgi:molybdenum cofactor cytidylyltransferase